MNKDKFTEGLINDIINTPDEDILKEVEQDYGDPLYITDKMRKLIKKVKQEVDMEKDFIDKIKKYVIDESNDAFGFCGVADMDNVVIINTGTRGTIKITIENREK